MGAYNIGISTVITTDAAYVHESFSTVDVGTTENVKITASDGEADDEFGKSVGIGSTIIVVGAPFNDVGINTDQGSVYIFDLDGNELGILTASNGGANDQFGSSVAVGATIIVVGAPFNDVGINTDQGSAYIFDFSGNQLGIITSSNGGANDQFGSSVAIGNDKIVVGAPLNDVNGNSDQGSVYFFDLGGNEVGILTASDGAALDEFGRSVAVENDKIVVGADEAHVGGVRDQGAVYSYFAQLTPTKILEFTLDDLTTSQLQPNYPIYISNTLVGNGATSINVNESTIIGIGTTYLDGLYNIAELNTATGVIICPVDASTDLTGISTTGTIDYPVGRYSWGRLSNTSGLVRSSNPIALNVNGKVVSGLSSYPIIQRRNVGIRSTGALPKLL